jgi:hypothetical protein
MENEEWKMEVTPPFSIFRYPFYLLVLFGLV